MGHSRYDRPILGMPKPQPTRAEARSSEIAPDDFVTAAQADEQWIRTAVAQRSFEVDLRQAKPFEKDALYFRWADKLLHSLGIAYPLYLHLLSDREKLARILTDEFFNNPRASTRRLGTQNLALIALKYVTRPATEEDNKSCSAYSTMLKLAHIRKVAPESFAVAMKDATLREARQVARKARPKRLVNKIKIEFVTPESTIRREVLLLDSVDINDEFCDRVEAALSAALSDATASRP